MRKKTENTNEQHDSLVKSLKSSEIEHIYFNEFALGVSKNDMFILVRRNGKEEAVLNMSHITAKSVALALMEAIEDFEQKTNQKIMVDEDVEKALESNNEEKLK